MKYILHVRLKRCNDRILLILWIYIYIYNYIIPSPKNAPAFMESNVLDPSSDTTCTLPFIIIYISLASSPFLMILSPFWKDIIEVCKANELKKDFVHFLNKGTYYNI